VESLRRAVCNAMANKLIVHRMRTGCACLGSKGPIALLVSTGSQSRLGKVAAHPWKDSILNNTREIERIEINDDTDSMTTTMAVGDACEVDKVPLRVAVLLSGGVDSSLALTLLKEAGHDVTAFYLQIWFQEDFRNSWDACPWEEDLEYCRAVCDRLGIPLKTVPLSEEYWSRVVEHSIAEVKAGRTPNPDILCNSRVKFGAFYEHLESHYASDFDRVASGHYARVVRPDDSSRVPHMMLTPDPIKDQTYFLANLKPQQLEKVMFPLGCFNKETVRQLAQEANLPNKARKDSQGICFLGKVKFDEFIKEHLGEWPGPLVDEDTDTVVGYHGGYWFYTIGQRKGIHLSGGPWYVTRKDHVMNTVYISTRPAMLKEESGNSSFLCTDVNWLVQDIGWDALRTQGDITCKVRHGPHMYSLVQCRPHDYDGYNENTLPRSMFIELDGTDQGLASGQYAVLYQDSRCLGCGTIVTNT
jgi:tRNA (5-methylaminomethyl-2-thiouridylate)-methyltransferase